MHSTPDLEGILQESSDQGHRGDRWRPRAQISRPQVANFEALAWRDRLKRYIFPVAVAVTSLVFCWCFVRSLFWQAPHSQKATSSASLESGQSSRTALSKADAAFAKIAVAAAGGGDVVGDRAGHNENEGLLCSHEAPLPSRRNQSLSVDPESDALWRRLCEKNYKPTSLQGESKYESVNWCWYEFRKRCLNGNMHRIAATATAFDPLNEMEVCYPHSRSEPEYFAGLVNSESQVRRGLANDWFWDHVSIFVVSTTEHEGHSIIETLREIGLRADLVPKRDLAYAQRQGWLPSPKSSSSSHPQSPSNFAIAGSKQGDGNAMGDAANDNDNDNHNDGYYKNDHDNQNEEHDNDSNSQKGRTKEGPGNIAATPKDLDMLEKLLGVMAVQEQASLLGAPISLVLEAGLAGHTALMGEDSGQSFIESFWEAVTQHTPCDWEVLGVRPECPIGTCVASRLVRVQPQDLESAALAEHEGLTDAPHLGILAFRTAKWPGVSAKMRAALQAGNMDLNKMLESLSKEIAFYAVPAAI